MAEQTDRSRSNSRPDRLKIIFIGNSGVGKTSLHRLFENHEVEIDPRPTVGLSVAVLSFVIAELGHRTIEAEVWDTAGSEKFYSMMTQHYRQADIVIFVYDITNRESFRNIDDYWLREVKKNNGNDRARLMLLGNKIDQDDRSEVNALDAQRYASANDMFYFEMSAIHPEYYNVLYDAIMTAVKHVINNGGPCNRLSQEIQINNNEPGEQANVTFRILEPAPVQQTENKCSCVLL